jgi:hypothetical protein
MSTGYAAYSRMRYDYDRLIEFVSIAYIKAKIRSYRSILRIVLEKEKMHVFHTFKSISLLKSTQERHKIT